MKYYPFPATTNVINTKAGSSEDICTKLFICQKLIMYVHLAVNITVNQLRNLKRNYDLRRDATSLRKTKQMIE